MRRPPHGPATRALAVLLDRSLARIAEAAADAREFDREAVRLHADLWDNYTVPLVRAFAAPSVEERESRARALLAWMGDWGEARRELLIALAGDAIEPLLAPARPDGPNRDYLGRVIAPQYPLTRETVTELAADYDLRGATIESFDVERADGTLRGALTVAVPRRYACGSASLHVWLDGITELAFTLPAGPGGVTFAPDPKGFTVSFEDGLVRTTAGECRPDDRSWHLSAAGRRADALRPPNADLPAPVPEPPSGDLSPDASAAAQRLRHAMLELRSVRYVHEADLCPYEHCAASSPGRARPSSGPGPGRRPAEAVSGISCGSGWSAAPLRSGPAPYRPRAPHPPRAPRSSWHAGPPTRGLAGEERRFCCSPCRPAPAKGTGGCGGSRAPVPRSSTCVRRPSRVSGR